MADRGWQTQGARRRGRGQQHDLSRPLDNVSITQGGQDGQNAPSSNRSGHRGARGSPPTGQQGNFGGQRGSFGERGGRHGNQLFRYENQRGFAGSQAQHEPRKGDIEADLQANYFKVDLEPVEILHRYSVEIKLPEDKSVSRRVKQRIVYLLVLELKRISKNIPIATNYHDLLVTVQKLSIEQFPHTVEIKYYDEDERQPRPDPEPGSDRNGPIVYNVKVDEVGPADVSDLNATREDSANGPKVPGEEIVNAVNVLFGYRPRQYCVRSPSQEPTVVAVGSMKFYGLTQFQSLGAGIEARHGFLKSVRQAEAGLLLNVGNTTSAFYQSGCLRTLIDVWEMAQKFWTYPGLENFIKGVRVKTNYLTRYGRKADGSRITEERIYTITGLGRRTRAIDPHPTPNNVSFEVDENGTCRNGKEKIFKAQETTIEKGKKRQVIGNKRNDAAKKTVQQYFEESKSNAVDPISMSADTADLPARVSHDRVG
jgi:N-terminal domain of argonaute/Argonaute linker 1 domain